MMLGRRKFSYLVIALILPQLFAACGTTKPSNFYLLNPVAIEPARPASESAPLKIAVTLVGFPEYLNRSQIARRTTDNAMEFAETERWAEPLQESVARALAENISMLMATPAVMVGPPRGRAQVDYSIMVDVAQFDTSSANTVQLLARWSINNKTNEPLTTVHRSSVSVPTKGQDYDAIAAAHSQAVAELSKEIVAALQEIP